MKKNCKYSLIVIPVFNHLHIIMGSKQINFFLAPEDLSVVLRFLNEMGCEVIKKCTRKAGQPVYYDLEKNQDFVFQVCLCTPEYLETLIFGYLVTRQEYCIDTTRSNTIEFSFGGFYPYSDKELHRSRFYLVTEYFEGDNHFRKDEEFLIWSDKIFKAFKKNFFLKNKSVTSQSYGTKNFINWVDKTKAVMTVDGTAFIVP